MDFAQDKPERREILPLHFVQGQNDNKRRAQNDNWMSINALACIIMVKNKKMQAWLPYTAES